MRRCILSMATKRAPVSDWRLLMTPKAQYIAFRLEAGASYSGSVGLYFQRQSSQVKSGVSMIQYFRIPAKLRAPSLASGWQQGRVEFGL